MIETTENNQISAGLVGVEAKTDLIDKELTGLFPNRNIQRVLLVAPPDVDDSLLDSSEYWANCFKNFGLSLSDLKN